jgi:23S rRNA A1618 N6-methylase RlmF
VRCHPTRCCPGSAGELWCPGGEVAFVSAIVDDSVAFVGGFTPP